MECLRLRAIILVCTKTPVIHLSVTCLSNSSHVMSYSLTPNAGSSTLSMLSIICHHLELSVSSDANLTLMEVLTSMLSSILADGTLPEEATRLMLEATIQTSHHLVAVQKAVGITRQKRETLLREGLNDRAEVAYLEMITSGMRSSTNQTSQRFGSVFRGWIQRQQLPSSLSYELTPRGPMLFSLSNTNQTLSTPLTLEWYLSWIDGEGSLLEMIDKVRLHLVAPAASDLRSIGTDRVDGVFGRSKSRCGDASTPLGTPRRGSGRARGPHLDAS